MRLVAILALFFFCSGCDGSSGKGEPDVMAEDMSVDGTLDVTDIADLQDTDRDIDASDTSDFIDDSMDAADAVDANDAQQDMVPDVQDHGFTEQLIEAGIVSDIYASPDGNHFFYLFRDVEPGEGSWNVLGGTVGVTHGATGQTQRFGLGESYHSGWLQPEFIARDHLYYARDIGAIGADTSLLLATPQSVEQVGWKTDWACMRVFEDGSVAWVELVGHEEPGIGELARGVIKLRTTDGTIHSFDFRESACRPDDFATEPLSTVALSPNGRYFAYWDYTFYDPQDIDFFSTIDLHLVDLEAQQMEPAYLAGIFNEPRGPLVFSDDSQHLVFLDQDEQVTAVSTADTGQRQTLPSDTYPHLSFTLLDSQRVLFKGTNDQSEDITVLGDITTGSETIIRNDAEWGLLAIVNNGQHAYVVTNDQLGLLDISTGEITTLGDKPTSQSGTAFDVAGNRAVYAVGSFDGGFNLMTVDAVAGESPAVVYEDYRLFLNGNFQPGVTLNHDGTKAFHMTYDEGTDTWDLASTSIPDGDTELWAEDVIRFAYHKDVDRMAIVRGEIGSDPYEAGQGLYLLVPSE